jgi:predicted nucleic acid-binding protein
MYPPTPMSHSGSEKTATAVTSFLDTSFVLSLYVSEVHSVAADAWFRQYRGIVAVSELTDVEVASALYRRFPKVEAARLHGIYRRDLASGTYRRFAVDPAVFALAEQLSERYGGNFGLRSLDALHLATALVNRADSLATFDTKLAAAAQAAGLLVIQVNP